MRKIVQLALMVLLALLLVAPAGAQAGNAGPERGTLLEFHPPRGIDPGGPVPFPIDPRDIPTGFASDEMQLVGFTSSRFGGNAGILNMSIACQREFRGSRTCTMGEINKSVFIPEAVGHGYAWVQHLGEAGGTPELNCRGWMSVSPSDEGTSIELGDCYGGLQMQSCDTRLRVSCCAKTGTVVTH